MQGVYDSNNFASLYDVIDPPPGDRGWRDECGRLGRWLLGPLFVGWASTHGRHATEVENMSEAIASCGVFYLAGSALLVIAVLSFAKRDLIGGQDRSI